MTAYYNEIDPFAAAWLRELIKAGQIAPGDVDERDIRDVRPDDLAGYAQCHFFAGIGVWSYALRLAGWPDDRPVWTGSCPCQPFSAAGKGGGFADERHLWPSWFHLVEQCRPAVVLGEQVASKDGLGWLDLVQADMEGAGYAIGALDTCSAGHGAPHIRQRLRFAADRAGVALGDAGWPGLEGYRQGSSAEIGRFGTAGPASASSESGGLADAHGGHPGAERQQRGGEQRQQQEDGRTSELAIAARGRRSFGGGPEQQSQNQRLESGYTDKFSGLADTECVGRQRGRASEACDGRGQETFAAVERLRDVGRPGPTNGFWRDADWIHCRDHKWRPVEPGTFPLAHGAPARVGRLRGYGNAVDAEATAAFIESYIEARAVDLRLTGVSRVADIFE